MLPNEEQEVPEVSSEGVGGHFTDVVQLNDELRAKDKWGTSMRFIVWVILRILLAPIPWFIRKRIMRAILGAYKDAENMPKDKK